MHGNRSGADYSTMTPPGRIKLKAPAVRAGAKSTADSALFDYLCADHKALRTAARKVEPDDAGRKLNRIYGLVLKYSRFFEPSLRSKKYKSGDWRQRFVNLLDLVIVHHDLSYCEGHVVVEGVSIPMDHGWWVTEEGSDAETAVWRANRRCDTVLGQGLPDAQGRALRLAIRNTETRAGNSIARALPKPGAFGLNRD